MSEPKINPEWPPPPRPTMATILAFVLALLTFILVLLERLDIAKVIAGLTVLASAWDLYGAVRYNRLYMEGKERAARNRQVP